MDFFAFFPVYSLGFGYNKTKQKKTNQGDKTMNEATSRPGEELAEDYTCAFLRDILTPHNFGGTSLGMYNLITSISALKMFVNIGMKPNAQWNLKSLKQYFGIIGSKQAMLDQLIQLRIDITEG
jgi:hypothetical protein